MVKEPWVTSDSLDPSTYNEFRHYIDEGTEMAGHMEKKALGESARRVSRPMPVSMFFCARGSKLPSGSRFDSMNTRL